MTQVNQHQLLKNPNFKIYRFHSHPSLELSKIPIKTRIMDHPNNFNCQRCSKRRCATINLDFTRSNVFAKTQIHNIYLIRTNKPNTNFCSVPAAQIKYTNHVKKPTNKWKSLILISLPNSCATYANLDKWTHCANQLQQLCSQGCLPNWQRKKWKQEPGKVTNRRNSQSKSSSIMS